MRAEEARKLSNSNKKTIDDILENIKRCAEIGVDHILFQDLHNDVVLKLMSMGYSVKIHQDIVGLENHIVSW